MNVMIDSTILIFSPIPDMPYHPIDNTLKRERSGPYLRSKKCGYMMQLLHNIAWGRDWTGIVTNNARDF